MVKYRTITAPVNASTKAKDAKFTAAINAAVNARL